ncbi:hypothetical protein RRG08_025852 [Elysia crispata]|uniref:Uncharacterized protein n=1 Tax=Elysia crispata TaxID=231223 RepID=A0AAE1CRP9_9GAST|nr:hypothetical protein RRG08_025852 [Elysia crispata]
MSTNWGRGDQLVPFIAELFLSSQSELLQEKQYLIVNVNKLGEGDQLVPFIAELFLSSQSELLQEKQYLIVNVNKLGGMFTQNLTNRFSPQRTLFVRVLESAEDNNSAISRGGDLPVLLHSKMLLNNLEKNV